MSYRRPRCLQERLPAGGRPGAAARPGDRPCDLPVSRASRTNLNGSPNAYLPGDLARRGDLLPGLGARRPAGAGVIHLLLGGGHKWDDVVVPFQIFSAGLLFRTSYKISDSLARAMGTVYQRAWRQAVYAGAVVVGALIGSGFGLEWVAVGVTGAIVLNYVLMAQLSLRTARIGWAEFVIRQGRGLALAALVAVASIPTVLALRAAGAGNVLTIAGGAIAGFGVVGLAWLIAPKSVLGEDGAWLVDVVRQRQTESPSIVEVSV